MILYFFPEVKCKGNTQIIRLEKTEKRHQAVVTLNLRPFLLQKCFSVFSFTNVAAKLFLNFRNMKRVWDLGHCETNVKNLFQNAAWNSICESTPIHRNPCQKRRCDPIVTSLDAAKKDKRIEVHFLMTICFATHIKVTANVAISKTKIDLISLYLVRKKTNPL